jgi:hypothetical protein
MLLGYVRDKIALNKISQDPISLDLKKTGLHIFKEKIPLNEIESLLRDFDMVKMSYSKISEGQLSGRFHSQGILTPFLQKYATNIAPSIKKFLNTEKVKVEISYYQESFPSQHLANVPGGEFHVDDNKANLKYFIYLSNVELSNGPFTCVPSTGSWGLKWSVLRGAFWELTKNRKYLYDYLIDIKYCKIKEMEITGTIGTHFIVDTTSLHRALPVEAGFRKVAVISFNRISILNI